MKKNLLLIAMIAACTMQAEIGKPSIAPAPPRVLAQNQVTVVNKSSSYTMQVEMPLPSTVKRSDLTHGYTITLKPGELKYGLQLPHMGIMYVTATNKYTDAKSAETPIKRFFATDVVFEINASGSSKPVVTATPLNDTQALAKGYQK